MEVIAPAQSFSVRDASAVSQARRAVVAEAGARGFSEEDAGRAALVATEMCTNLLKHGDGGELVLSHVESADRPGFDLLALDTGPGMADPEKCLQDGYSTAGSPGSGLGAIRRLSQSFDLFSQIGRGTAVHARVMAAGRKSAPSEFEVCGFSVPITGEIVSGDCWTMRARQGSLIILGADGLGHGPGAAEASQAACRLLQEQSIDDPALLMERTHHALRPTRGAAVSIADIDIGAGRISFSSIGNVAGTMVTGAAARKMVSHNGTVGHIARHFRAMDYPFAGESAFILHSDGLGTSWQLDRYPGLMHRSAGVIAGVLYRDFKRGRDDALVVVAKWGSV